MSKLKKFFVTLLGISAGEFSGFSVLIITAVICSLGLFAVDRFTQNPYSNYEKDAAMLDSLLVTMGSFEPVVTEPASIQRFPFNPNTASHEQLVQLGFPAWLANQLINYRNKGGKFGKPEDLKKLYNFPDSLFMLVEPFVLIPEVKDNASTVAQVEAHAPPVKAKAPDEKKIRFDLNKADTAMLQTIKGIGSVLSKRIVTYRDKLGGFRDPGQLHEVYHLDSTTVNVLLETAFISNDFVPHQIPVNSADEKQLAAHPYVSWKQAKLIVAYRNQHGNFSDKEALLNVYTINKEWLEKIDPYLSF